MKVPDHVISQISDKLSIVEIVSRYVPLKKKGSKYWGCCPFHQEKTPSFSVTPEKNMYYCFGCQKGGSVFNFLMEMEHLSFPEVLEQTAEQVGVVLPKSQPMHNQEEVSILELYEKVARLFVYFLNEREEGASARGYLEQRGLGRDVVDRFGLGYAPSDRYWLYRFLRGKNYSPALLEKSGLFSRNHKEVCLFSDRLMFPICDSRGKHVAFGGRRLGAEGPKYINSPETLVYKKNETLYGLHLAADSIRKNKTVLLCEGYMDVIAFYMGGIENVVAPLGTAFTENQARRIKRYTDSVLLVFDGDAAGIKATKKGLQTCEKLHLQSGVVSLPEGQDPDDILKKEGLEALHNLLKCPINSFEYLLDRAEDEYDITRPEGKEAAFEDLAPFINSIESQVKKDGFLKLLADRLEVKQESVFSDYQRVEAESADSGYVSRPTAEQTADQSLEEWDDPFFKPVKPVNVKIVQEERAFLLALCVNREYFEKIRNQLKADDLESDTATDLYIALEECFRHEEVSLDALLARLDDEALRSMIIQAENSNEFSINVEEYMQTALIRLRQRSLIRKRARIEEKLKQAESNPSGFRDLDELIMDKMYLDKELEKLKVRANDRPKE